MAVRGMGVYRNLVRETNIANVAVLFVEFFPLVLGSLYSDGFSHTTCTIRMGLSIICFKESQVDFPTKYVLQSLNIAFIIANSADPDAFHLVLTVFHTTLLGVSSI